MSQIEQPVEQSGIANLVQMAASCSKQCVLAKMALFWQNLRKTEIDEPVGMTQNGKLVKMSQIDE